MTSILVQPVVMAGGGGTRLWPLSRAGFPKQFLALGGKETLFQAAVARLQGLSDAGFSLAPPVVVGNDEHRFLIQEQLRELGLPSPATLLLEPLGRNTAPAMTLAALHAADDPVLVVVPADQTVADGGAFRDAISSAIRIAAEGAICILGITPVRPETGYGYVLTEAAGMGGASQVSRFVEKPNAATAARYLAEGGYYWNSGIFVLRASVWLAALEQFRPDILASVRAAWDGRNTDAQFVRPSREAFVAVPSESVDYAVMERCPGSRFDLRIVPLDAGWNDLGAWDAVWQQAEKDVHGNSSVGDVLLHDTRNAHVHATSRLVTVVGLENVVVVETADAVLVVDRERSQDVKQVVTALGSGKRTEQVLHRKVHRPWGWYDSIDQGGRFQVKRIMVKPGASLSLQMHHHRAEHWIVVSGTAEVTNGDRIIMLSENQSTFIPLGEKHRLANRGKVPLEIIEVQSGSYLGEDDIVRFEDTYGRN
jgi:mannose-1-phosphate guanylyltransferase/mannose-6-phosphate isomerase